MLASKVDIKIAITFITSGFFESIFQDINILKVQAFFAFITSTSMKIAQLPFTCSNSTIETVEKDNKNTEMMAVMLF